MADRKLQIALYWGAGCGGCDVAVLDTDEFILAVGAAADIHLWPIAVDGKYADIEALPDRELDVSFFNGAVRNSENEHIARLLRRKSKLLVAFGTCAHLGGIPGLANRTTRNAILTRAYVENPSIEEGNQTLPMPLTVVGVGELHLPVLYERVLRLEDVAEVDYFVPGCPPAPAQVRTVLEAVVGGKLPERGSVVGASDRTLCDECTRKKDVKKVEKYYRPWEIIPDPEVCLLEQGILCAGSATRGGCGVRCPNSGVGCRGCYGPPPDVSDQGAKLLAAITSIVESRDPNEIDTILSGLPDFAGYAYRYGLPASLLQRSERR